jgi:hypothetical protein
MMKTREKTKPTGQPRENSEMKRFLDGTAGWGVDWQILSILLILSEFFAFFCVPLWQKPYETR